MNYTTNSFRLTGIDKHYYASQLQIFADHWDKDKYKSICFGKQDSRGALSITFFNHSHRVPMQRHFINKDAMLNFIVGYNEAKNNRGFI